MDEMTASLSPELMRSPLTDATNRANNCLTPRIEQVERLLGEQNLGKSPDRMSIVASPPAPKGNAEMNCLFPRVDSPAGSNRNSTISATSIISGRGKRKTHVGPWQLGRTLGRGATGRVRLAKHAMTGQTAAIKIVSKKSAVIAQSESIAAMDRSASHFSGTGARQMPSGIEREVVIMKLIEHPNVISLYDVWENRGELYLVLEYVEGGELFDYVSNNGPLPEEEAVRLFRQIIAGLGYCHRFNICHRDLKPENILLDSRHNVKLADFGMAALQPAGHWLNTSCGSPHYAAPEIIYGRKYRGDKADIWSCGIILYALLTGYLPFDGGDLPNTLRLVKKGDYSIPSELSDEAGDLIQRILQKRPEDRITMKGIWIHPLLKKYEKLHQAMSSHYVGPPPPLTVQDCGPPVLNRQDIDIDLLRNLQTLWHDVRPEILIERLTSPEPTHERMFYNALVKFRNEQLENYQGQPLDYSASDYHHISKVPRHGSNKHKIGLVQGGTQRRTHMPANKANNRRNNSIKDSMSSATVESYDPFRSSPKVVITTESQQAQVTIHRNVCQAVHNELHFDPVQPPNPVLNEVQQDGADCLPSSPFSVVRNKKSKVTSMKSIHSRTSQSSSRRAMSVKPTPRSVSYKRNVCFRHIRKRSQGSPSVKTRRAHANGPEMPQISRQPSESSFKSAVEAAPCSDRPSSPVLPAQPFVVRGARVTIKNPLNVKKVRDSWIWKDEARKVSTELGQICEEAFNLSSLSTGCTTSTCLDPETPATSVSMASPEHSQHQIAVNNPKSRTPQYTSPGSPPSSTVVQLAETRRKLIEHSTQDGTDDIPDYIAAVIDHLDRLIEHDKLRQRSKSDRTDDGAHSLHGSFVNSSNEPTHLPIISEEVNNFFENRKISDHEQVPRNDSQSAGNISPQRHSRDCKSTIRMVPGRSFEVIKPLSIHKNGNVTLFPPRALNESKVWCESEIDDYSLNRYASAYPRYARELDPIDEVPMAPKRSHTKAGDNKKWSWFRHRLQVPADLWTEVKSGSASSATVVVHEINSPGDNELDQQDQPTRTSEPSEKQKGGFFKFNWMRKHSKKSDDITAVPENVVTDPPLKRPLERVTSFDTDNTQKPLPRILRPTGKSHNWFARVFQIKPATRVVALNTSKIKGRKEVLKILREWKQYGVEHVYLDKANSVIHGSVGDNNVLRLRAVEFSAEFYTVLEHGRQANLSLVRFKQERGAASSFHKVVEMLDKTMQQRGLLVEDPDRAKKMARILDSFPEA